jgi:hypothetical protein
MAALGFFNNYATPEQLSQRRAELDYLASTMGRAQNVGAGVGDIFKGLAIGLSRRGANKAENAGRATGDGLFNDFMSGYGRQPSLQAPMQSPQTGGGEAFPNPAALPGNDAQPPARGPARVSGGYSGIPQTVEAPKQPAIAAQQGGGGVFGTVRAAGKGWTEMIGPDGRVVRREGARNWRNHNPGNIEYGPFAKSNGAIGTDGRFAVFPSYEAGRKAKEALLFDSKGYRGKTIAGAITRYAPQFENNTSAYINQVAQAAGVSPFTPLSQLNPQQRVAMLDAMQRVEGFKVGREKSGGKPVQVASNDPQFMPTSASPQDMTQAQPIPAPQQQMQEQPQQVAQAQPESGPGPQFQKAMQVYANPWATPEQKQLAMKTIEMEMQRQDPRYQMEMQSNQLGLEKSRFELEQMRNPKPKYEQVGNTLLEIGPNGVKPAWSAPAERQKPIEVGGRLIDPNTYQPVYEPPAEPEKPTPDIQNYKFYADAEKAAGRTPLGPLEFEQAVRKSGATTVNNNIGSEVGTIPQGYELFTDPKSGGRTMRPIAGSQAAVDAQNAQTAKDHRLQNQGLANDLISEDIDRAIAVIDGESTFSPATGFTGDKLSGIGGTRAHQLKNLIDTVGANISFDRLQQMRAESPTGGALGSVTVRELELLQATKGAITQSQNSEELKYNLNRLWNLQQDIVHGKGDGPERRKLNAPAQITSPKNNSRPDGWGDEWDYLTPDEKKSVLGKMQ